jgi:hypothetical protein
MEEKELKAYAEAKAMEKYSKIIYGAVNSTTLINYQIDMAKREAYAQAIIDAYEERERVNEELLDLVTEVLKVWNEDGDNGRIQMNTPIAWYRVIRKAELAKAIIDTYEEKKSDAVEFLKWIRENAEMNFGGIWLRYKSIPLNEEELYEIFKQSKTK